MLKLFPYVYAANSCIISNRPEEVLGSSMEPMIKNGQKIQALYGYYSCHDIKRNDIVLFHFTASKDPLIKRVVALPGDKFSLKQDSKQLSVWQIIVNGKVLTNSEGKPYSLTDKSKAMLALFEHDYKGVVPADAYMILGDQIGGTLDSTRYGLVAKSAIIAKAIVNK